MSKWKEKAKDTQKYFYLSFSGRQWDVYDLENERDLIVVKVCFAVFGPPQSINDANENNIRNAYSSDQKESVKKIVNKIIDVHYNYSSSTKLHTGTIFVYCFNDEEGKEYCVPVFRVAIASDDKTKDCRYIDQSCRVYKNWTDWKENNTLPKIQYCYPTRGYYTCSTKHEYEFNNTKEPNLQFGESPRSSTASQVAQVLDVGAGIVGLASAGVAIASLFTPLGPFVIGANAVGVASALYGGGRSVQRLVDKGSHDESLTDMESIMCAISIVSLPLHAFTSAAKSSLTAGAKAGRIFTPTIRAGATLLTITTCVFDSVTLLFGFANMIQKYKDGHLSTLDVIQFSVSVFFFSHTIIEPKTASGIIKQAQQNHFQDVKNRMTDAQAKKSFDKFVNENNKSMREGAQVAKTINKIKDPNSFFKLVGEDQSSVRIASRSGKTVIINNEVKISPNRLNQLSQESGRELLKITKQFQQGQINGKEYNKFCTNLGRNERIFLESSRKEALGKIAAVFNTDEEGLKKVKVNNKKLFANLQDGEVDRLRTVFKDTARNYNKDIISSAMSLAEDLNVSNVQDLASVIELVAVESFKNELSKTQFKSFVKNLMNKNSPERAAFLDEIKADSIKAEKILEKSNLKFKNSITATYHYRKHGKSFGTTYLPMDVYLNDIPSDLFREKYLLKDVYTQDGFQDGRVQTYANSSNHQFGILHLNKKGEPTVATVFTNEPFFQDWTQKLALSQEQLPYTQRQYGLSNPSVPSFFETLQKNVFLDMGFIINTINIHNNSSIIDIKNLRNLSEKDLQKMRKMAEILTALS